MIACRSAACAERYQSLHQGDGREGLEDMLWLRMADGGATWEVRSCCKQ